MKKFFLASILVSCLFTNNAFASLIVDFCANPPRCDFANRANVDENSSEDNQNSDAGLTCGEAKYTLTFCYRGFGSDETCQIALETAIACSR